LAAIVGVVPAAAQTVLVRDAPAGSTIEITLPPADPATATVGANGEATVTLDAMVKSGRAEVVAQIYDDTCPGPSHHFVFVERNQPPPPAGVGCARQDSGGFFVVRAITVFVINIGGDHPTVMLRQGPVPPAWLQEGPLVARHPNGAPPGLAVWGGTSFLRLQTEFNHQCGNLSGCNGNALNLSYNAGGILWLTRHLGANVGYIRSAKATADASPGSFTFKSSFDVDVLTLAGDIGLPAGPVRLFVEAGGNRHRAKLTTNETTTDLTVTVGGVSQTVPGGTQTSVTNTGGWGWELGGGLEVWIKNRAAVYATISTIAIRGTDLNGGEARVNDRTTLMAVGLRFRIGN
jgi:hypothetical protein